MTKEEVYKLATVENPIINDNGNRIEFANGDMYAKQSITNLYRKVKVHICIYNHRTTKTNQKYPSVNL